MFAVGHTHIDVAWLWTVEQTRQKAARSFQTVLKLMEEFPQYRFTSSQPVLYQFVKEDHPLIYEQIKERIAEGRWENRRGHVSGGGLQSDKRGIPGQTAALWETFF